MLRIDVPPGFLNPVQNLESFSIVVVASMTMMNVTIALDSKSVVISLRLCSASL